jgi:hypothetical protein
MRGIIIQGSEKYIVRNYNFMFEGKKNYYNTREGNYNVIKRKEL